MSALRLLGVFTLSSEELHVHIPPHAARLRVPPGGASRHWSPPIGERPSGSGMSHPWDLLAHAIVCQPPAAAVATLDSALHWGLIVPSELDLVFAAVPRKYRVIRKMLDGRAESGPESLMRLILRRLGLKVEVQVRIDGVGRVDLLVDGWLVVECDSDAHHSGPLAHRVDRRRDLALAALGYTTLRPMAADIMWHPDRVVAAVRGLLRARRR
ncbi:endonuclease domain-containing protein [Microbacterium sp. 1P06AB]|uniref:endonuclease domain-containing protein n=1 Tax=Microbacterium sp. 1P06AB TaxID=3132289 RepID=UPI0039A52FF2